MDDVYYADQVPPEFRAQEQILAKWVGEILNKQYPGHLWAVSVQDGLVQVLNLALSGRFGFVLSEADIVAGKYGRRKVVMAGGEILERYKLSRGKAIQSEYDALMINLRGEVVGETDER